MFDFSNYSTKSKNYDVSNKLVTGKIKDETRLEWNMYSLLVDGNSLHKKSKGINGNVVAKISHKEYEDVLLNN